MNHDRRKRHYHCRRPGAQEDELLIISDCLSVCLSVRPSGKRHDVTKWKKFYIRTYTKLPIPLFRIMILFDVVLETYGGLHILLNALTARRGEFGP